MRRRNGRKRLLQSMRSAVDGPAQLSPPHLCSGAASAGSPGRERGWPAGLYNATNQASRRANWGSSGGQNNSRTDGQNDAPWSWEKRCTDRVASGRRKVALGKQRAATSGTRVWQRARARQRGATCGPRATMCLHRAAMGIWRGRGRLARAHKCARHTPLVGGIYQALA